MITTVAAVLACWTAATIPAGCLLGRRLRHLHPEDHMPDQSVPRPAGLDALPDDGAAATAEAAALLAPLAAKARAHQAQHDAQVRAAVTHQAVATIRTDAALRATEGEADLAAYGRELADLIATEAPTPTSNWPPFPPSRRSWSSAAAPASWTT